GPRMGRKPVFFYIFASHRLLGTKPGQAGFPATNGTTQYGYRETQDPETVPGPDAGAGPARRNSIPYGHRLQRGKSPGYGSGPGGRILHHHRKTAERLPRGSRAAYPPGTVPEFHQEVDGRRGRLSAGAQGKDRLRSRHKTQARQGAAQAPHRGVSGQGERRRSVRAG